MGTILRNKICLVTGASKGIGRAIVERFAEEGAVVYANARESKSIDDWCVQRSAQYNTTVLPVYFDIRDEALSKQVILQIKKDRGSLDVLVNNAAMVTYELLPMINFDSFRTMIDINIIATIQLIQVASRIMAKQKSGSIINISSMVGVKGAKGQLAYSATKGALNAITLSAAKELATSNIRVNAIAPGMVASERFMEVFENNFKDRLDNVGMGRLGTPREIADACVFLGSELSTYLTGQIIGVDGSFNL